MAKFSPCNLRTATFILTRCHLTVVALPTMLRKNAVICLRIFTSNVETHKIHFKV